MPNLIVILEDSDYRYDVMKEVLAREFPDHRVRIFDNAPEMIGWLREGIDADPPCLMSLDHDLGPDRVVDGEKLDPGTGREVVECMASLAPACPVIVHSSNGLAVPGMLMALEEAGWTATRVIPLPGVDWIDQSWIAEVRERLGVG